MQQLIWVLVVTVPLLIVVLPLIRMASRLLRGEEELEAGGSWGRQLSRKRRGGPS